MNFSLIAAACENMGIGFKGDLPWHLKNELKYFSRMTKRKQDDSKTNVVIMGRKTYFGVPESKRPLPERINVVLTRNPAGCAVPESVILAKSFEEALEKISEPKLAEQIENVWIVGGSSVYEEAMKSNMCHRVYLTDIKGTFECDTFFPPIPDGFKLVSDPDVPSEMQEENGVKYQYKIYEKL